MLHWEMMLWSNSMGSVSLTSTGLPSSSAAGRGGSTNSNGRSSVSQLVPRSVLRCLLNILREDKEHLAAQWLSGAAYLTENELRYLGVPEPLQRGEMGVVIRLEFNPKALTPGWHGVHIHATGQCDAPFTGAGSHVNHGDPEAPHGLLNPGGPDDGDLPNIHADTAGQVRAELFTTRARIAAEGPGQWLWDADGSALVIHANADDHVSQPIGGAGSRVACGVMAAG